MKRILVLNNYDLKVTTQEVVQNHKPDHHLYGVNRLIDHGYDCSLSPFRQYTLLNKLDLLLRKIRFPIPLGDLDQQFSAWLNRKSIDLIYAPCQTQTQLLSYLRAIGLFKVPIVNICHHALERKGRLNVLRKPFLKLQLRGTDAFPTINRVCMREIAALAHGSCRSGFLRWGPDLSFYHVAEGSGNGYIAAGRTGRDFVTFGRAATKEGTTATILCLTADVQPEFDEFGRNVTVKSFEAESCVTYPELVRIFASSRALAIPMYRGESLCGLTSLTDALGVGKPVIMTRNRGIELDIEAEKIGFWVDPEDVVGWMTAMRWFEANPEKAISMGKRARQIAESEWNSQSFADQIARIFEMIFSAMPACESR
jgi:hypothetical protein